MRKSHAFYPKPLYSHSPPSRFYGFIPTLMEIMLDGNGVIKMKFLLFGVISVFFGLALICLTGHECDAQIKPSSITGVWLLDDGQGNTAWDSSANRNHGKFSDSKGIKWVEGKFGGALEFKGTDYVIIKNTPSLELNETISIALWTKINTVGQYPSLIFKGICGKAGYWGLHEMPDTKIIYARIDTTGGINQTSSRIDNAADGEWHHIVFVFDEGKVVMFRDGKQLPELAYNHGNGFGSKDDLGIGSGFYPQDPRELDAVIDEVGIFNIAITSDDVKNIMDNGYKEALGVSISVDAYCRLATLWAKLKLQ